MFECDFHTDFCYFTTKVITLVCYVIPVTIFIMLLHKFHYVIMQFLVHVSITA